MFPLRFRLIKKVMYNQVVNLIGTIQKSNKLNQN